VGSLKKGQIIGNNLTACLAPSDWRAPGGSRGEASGSVGLLLPPLGGLRMLVRWRRPCPCARRPAIGFPYAREAVEGRTSPTAGADLLPASPSDSPCTALVPAKVSSRVWIGFVWDRPRRDEKIGKNFGLLTWRWHAP
jgi:hypothetical protein